MRIFLEQPEEPFEVIALVSASAHTGDFASAAKAEAAALEELRKQAGKAGANGVVEIVREVVDEGTVLSSSAYGHETRIRHDVGSVRVGSRTRSGSGTTVVSHSSSIQFRAKAIFITR